MLISTHCHSHYSFDCKTTIEDIIESCLKSNIQCLLITDHDVFSLSNEDIEKFVNKGIRILEAIEFTTSESAHVIGVCDGIKKLEKPRYHYSAREISSALKGMGGWVILPHPTHKTGLLNGKVSNEDADYCLKLADFIEIESSKYGLFDVSDVLKKYENLKPVISDDAHHKNDIGLRMNYVNLTNLESDTDEILREMYASSKPFYNKKKLYPRQIKNYIVSLWLYKKVVFPLKEMLRKR